MQALTVDSKLERPLCPRWGIVGTAAWGMIIFVAFVVLQTLTLGVILSLSDRMASLQKPKRSFPIYNTMVSFYRYVRLLRPSGVVFSSLV